MRKILDSVVMVLGELVSALWGALQIVLWAVVPAFILYMLVQLVVVLLERVTGS